LPSTFSALAFEQVNDISGEGINDNLDKFEFLAATAKLVGPVFDNSDLLGKKYLHGSPSKVPVEWFHDIKHLHAQNNAAGRCRRQSGCILLCCADYAASSSARAANCS
jgi:hypothetical protein